MRFITIALLVSLLGCGGGSLSSAPPTVNGTWQLVGKSSVFNVTVTGTGTLAQSGKSVTGTLTLSGTPCATTAPLSGTISNNAFTFQVTEGTQPVSFTGTLNSSFTSASGTYAAPTGGCTAGDSGTWSATKQ